MLDFSPVHRGEKTSQQLAEGMDRSDLARLTNEMCDLQLEAIRDAVDEDVDFVPDDPAANDTYAGRPEDVGPSWTLGPVVRPATAPPGESAPRALPSARRPPGRGRRRADVPWRGACRRAAVLQRLPAPTRRGFIWFSASTQARLR